MIDKQLFIQHSRDEPRVRVFQACLLALRGGDDAGHVVRRGRDERDLKVHVWRPAAVLMFCPERPDALAALHHLAHALERYRRGVEVSKQPACVENKSSTLLDGVEVDGG